MAANQSAANELEKNDLQVGMGTADNTGSKVEFNSMVHSMGLVNLTLGSKTVPSTRVFKPGSTSEKLFDRAPTTSITATSNFTASVASNSASLCNKSTGIYLLVGKPTTTVTFTGNSSDKYTWNSTYSFSKNTGEVKTVTPSREYDNAGWGFDYTGAVQTFTAPTTGTYKLECWGAQGGNMDMYSGGKGGYVAGIIPLTSGTILYAYVGGQAQAFNGAGISLPFQVSSHYGNSGGGATDFRLIKGSTWKEFTSLKSRIIVAAGGGGANYRNYPVDNGTDTYWIYGEGNGGYGGGLTGGEGQIKNTNRNGYTAYGYIYATGANQTEGGDAIKNEVILSNGNGASYSSETWGGSFGYCKSDDYQSCGGSGYYGGSSSLHCGASGGSSFISGHSGCNAISESSTESNIIHTGQPNHYSGYVFTNSVMKAGNETMPSPSGGTETGHTGNGYAIITQLSY